MCEMHKDGNRENSILLSSRGHQQQFGLKKEQVFSTYDSLSKHEIVSAKKMPRGKNRERGSVNLNSKKLFDFGKELLKFRIDTDT